MTGQLWLLTWPPEVAPAGRCLHCPISGSSNQQGVQGLVL